MVGQPLRYWATTDTYLDPEAPADVNGNSPSLTTGNRAAILIRFGDLTRVVGNRKVLSARLVLTGGSAQGLHLRRVSAIKKDWLVGPRPTLGALVRREPLGPPDTLGANWKVFGGSQNWERDGAGGSGDAAPLASINLVEAGPAKVALEGLGPQVTEWAKYPSLNHGLLIETVEARDFASSEALTGRPELEIQLGEAEKQDGARLQIASVTADGPGAISVKVVNTGTEAPASPATIVVDRTGGSGTAVPLNVIVGPGRTEAFHVDFAPLDQPQPSRSLINVRLQGTGVDARYAEATYFAKGQPVEVTLEEGFASRLKASGEDPEAWVVARLNQFNRSVLPFSQYSFVPSGPANRARLTGFKLGTETLVKGPSGLESYFRKLTGENVKSPLSGAGAEFNLPAGLMNPLYPGFSGWGDTRFDGGFPAGVNPPYQKLPDLEPQLLNFGPTDLLNLTEAFEWNGGQPTLPKISMIQFKNQDGDTLKGVAVKVYGQGATGFTKQLVADDYTSSNLGIVRLVDHDFAGGKNAFGTADYKNQSLLIEATLNGATDYVALPAWQLMDAAARGRAELFIQEFRLSLPLRPIDTVDLAKGKIVTDSLNSPPAALIGLTTEGNNQAVELEAKQGNWIEIDLGRDRTLGEIQFFGTLPKAFDIRVYGTGQQESMGSTYVREIDWDWTSQTRRTPGGPTIYRGRPVSARFIRLVVRGGEKTATLMRVKVFGSVIN